MVILQSGGLTTGGLNFDAKVRRNSTDPEDLFLAHIGGIDAFARGLEIAVKLIEESPIIAMRKSRYGSFEQGDGLRFSRGELKLEQLANLAGSNEDLPSVSGKQELIENIINQYL